MTILKDISKVTFANSIALVAGIVTGFIVPAFLSVEQYSYLKTFGLVLSFAGIFHLGYIDGIYIKYGGKFTNEINMSLFKTEKLFFIIFQLIVSVSIIVIGLLIKEIILVAVAISILPFNILSYYQFYYQATGQFTTYSRIRIIIPNLILIFNLILIYGFQVKNYIYYISAEVLAYSLSALYLEISLRTSEQRESIAKNIKLLLDNFRIGFYIMLGNLAMLLFFSLGRWVVKLFLIDTEFAYYSFATSMMQILTIIISSIALTFYPYLNRLNNTKDLQKIKYQLLIVGAILSSSYFIISFIVQQLVPKYSSSLEILGILFGSFPAYVTINALYINLYKVLKNGRRYFRVIIINLVVSCILVSTAYILYKNTISIAIATSLSFYFWHFYSSFDLKNIFRISFKEILALTVYLAIFLTCLFIAKPIIAFLLFSGTITVLSILFFKKETTELFNKTIKQFIFRK